MFQNVLDIVGGGGGGGGGLGGGGNGVAGCGVEPYPVSNPWWDNLVRLIENWLMLFERLNFLGCTGCLFNIVILKYSLDSGFREPVGGVQKNYNIWRKNTRFNENPPRSYRRSAIQLLWRTYGKMDKVISV